MRALTFDGNLRLQEVPEPAVRPGEVLIRVKMAGICNTDHEITRGYIPGFCGILGHEFWGYVVQPKNPALEGKRVTAEINCSCGSCPFCKKGIYRHCAGRSVIGILRRDGALADYISVPEDNLIVIPEEIPDDCAIFIEPLAAACEILEQVPIDHSHSVLLLGDGKLALLIAEVLARVGCQLLVVGKHRSKIAYLKEMGVEAILLDEFTPTKFDRVIEASGDPTAFLLGTRCVKPRGLFILKSTYAQSFPFNPADIVVNEITLVGSRCGRFQDAIHFLTRFRPPLGRFVSGRYSLPNALQAFEESQRSQSLKVVIDL